MRVVAERLPLDDPWGADGRWVSPRCIDGTKLELWKWTLNGATIQGTYRNDETSTGCRIGDIKRIHSPVTGTVDPELMTIHLEYWSVIGHDTLDLRKVE